jgi:signal recognition particle subunit SRP54
MQGVFKELRGEGHLTDYHLETALRAIRLSLLEADVALPVVRQFTARVRERAVGAKVAEQLSPAQEVTRIVRDELRSLLGGELADLALHGKPAVIALVGLQGSGKTTSAAKLARLLKTRGRYPLIIAADLARPAAVQQLVTSGGRSGSPCSSRSRARTRFRSRASGVREAKQTGRDTVIVDTAGRLHIDETLMAEIRAVAAAVEPDEILFVADAMTGQDAVKSAAGFAEALALTGIILTKTDGDARGGAALSVVTTTGKPIKFVGVGEKPEDFEPFHPTAWLADPGRATCSPHRKVEATVDAGAAQKLAEKTAAGEFTLEDLKEQLASMKKMGPLESLIDLLPKGGAFKGLRTPQSVDEKALTRTTAIIDSMTVEERRYPQILNGSRKKRVASGSGTSVAEINRLIKQYQEMRKMVKAAKKGMRGLDMSKMAFPVPKGDSKQ